MTTTEMVCLFASDLSAASSFLTLIRDQDELVLLASESEEWLDEVRDATGIAVEDSVYEIAEEIRGSILEFRDSIMMARGNGDR